MYIAVDSLRIELYQLFYTFITLFCNRKFINKSLEMLIKLQNL